MAQSSAFLTYDAVGNRENLMDVVTDISPLETPMLSSFRKEKASARYVEWTTYALASAASNAQIEGVEYSYSKPSAKARTGNYTQIFMKTFEVSDTERVVAKTGVEDEYAFRMQNALKEIARDMENAIVTGTGNSGASGTARELKGVSSWITTNNETGSGTGTQALTETLFNTLLQTVWTAGGTPDTVYCNGFQKRQISSFSASNTRNVDASGKKLINMIAVYESDFGILNIKLDRYITATEVLVLEQDKWAIATLRPVKQVEVAKTGSATKGVVEGELTVVSYNEKASGKITELTTA